MNMLATLTGLTLMGATVMLGVAPASFDVKRLPLAFEETRPGQFLAQAAGAVLVLDSKGVTVGPLTMRIAKGHGSPEGERLLTAAVTRFEGPTQRTSRLYERVRFTSVYSGIDLVFYGHAGMLEFDFVVKPGAQLSDIHFEVDGATPQVAADGSLELRSGDTLVRWNPPVLYEREGGRNISGAFAVQGREVRFECGDYDRSKTLVIDPVLNYASYLGSTGNEFAFVAADGQGNFYLAGPTTSQDLRVTAGSFQTAHAGQSASVFAGDAFVAKFTSTGALAWLTYVGGKGDDVPHAIAVDPQGNVYIAGFTNSVDFPMKNPAQATFGGRGGVAVAPIGDAFLTKLNPAGTQLLYSTYLGGRNDDVALGLALDTAGNAYIAGATLSRDFPVTAGVVQGIFKGQGGQQDFPKLNAPWFSTGDGFVAKFDSNGVLKWATYLGGSNDDGIVAIAVDANQNVYCGGLTLSRDFPVSANAPRKTFGGVEQLNYFGNFGDGFVAKLNSSGSAIVYATYIGGIGDDAVTGIAVDALGQAYVTGSTSSPNFFTTPGAFQRSFVGPGFLPLTQDVLFGEAFYVQLSADGSTIQYATMLGGTGDEIGTAIALDPSGSVWITGVTSSRDLPITSDALQSKFTGGGTYDGFLFQFDSSGKRVFGTYLGGSGNDIFGSMAIDSAGSIYLSGSTASPDLPVTAGAAQKTFGGLNRNTKFKGDAFVMRLSSGSGPVTPPATNGVSAIANTASQTAGMVAPGMEFDATGLGLGTNAGTTLSSSGVIGTMAGTTRILFDGTPAPLLSSSATKVRGFVPFNVAGKAVVQVVAEVNGQRLAPLSVPVADAAPGIFTIDGTGTGQALSYNTDGSANSADLPAARQATLTFFITGGGVTNPAVADGILIIGVLPGLAQTVTVTIGGASATVVRATTMPFEVGGVIEVVVMVPDDAPSGAAGVSVVVGSSAPSRDGVIVWVQ